MSIANSSYPGMVFTFSTVAGLIVGSNVETGGRNTSSLSGKRSANDSMRSIRRTVETRYALIPRSGVDPWVVLPSIENLNQTRFFSDTSTMEPLGEPQSGTNITSSSEKYPWSRRYSIPYVLAVSSSATYAIPIDMPSSSDESKNLDANIDEMTD